jgi:hypothetical protein
MTVCVCAYACDASLHMPSSVSVSFL